MDYDNSQASTSDDLLKLQIPVRCDESGEPLRGGSSEEFAILDAMPAQVGHMDELVPL